MLKKISIILWCDALQSIQDFRRIMLYTAAGLVFIAFAAAGFRFLFAQDETNDALRLLIVNQDTSPYVDLMFSGIGLKSLKPGEQLFNSKQSGLFDIRRSDDFTKIYRIDVVKDPVYAQKEVQEDRAFAAVIIRKGFIGDLLGGGDPQLTIISNRKYPVQSYMFEQFVSNMVEVLVTANSSYNAVHDYYGMVGMTSVQRARKGDMYILDSVLTLNEARGSIYSDKLVTGVNNLTSIEYYFISGMVVILLFVAIGQGRLIFSDKSGGVLQRIRLAGVSLPGYLAGKLGGMCFAGAVYSIVFPFVGGLYLIKYQPNFLLPFFAIYMLCLLATSSLGMLLTFVFGSLERYLVAANLLAFCMAAIGGSLVPAVYLSPFLREAGKLTIHYWILQANMAVASGSWADMGASCAVLAAASIVFYLLSIWLATWREGCVW